MSSIKIEKPKFTFNSKVMLGDVTIFIQKKFNWFNRLMLKLVFGIIVKNIERDDIDER